MSVPIELWPGERVPPLLTVTFLRVPTPDRIPGELTKTFPPKIPSTLRFPSLIFVVPANAALLRLAVKVRMPLLFFVKVPIPLVVRCRCHPLFDQRSMRNCRGYCLEGLPYCLAAFRLKWRSDRCKNLFCEGDFSGICVWKGHDPSAANVAGVGPIKSLIK